MKKLLSLALAVSVYITQPAFAASYTIEYSFDLFKLDAKVLEEPPSQFEILVKIRGPGEENPFTKEVLREAAAPLVKNSRELIEGQMKLIDKLFAEGDITRERAEEEIAKLNGWYEEFLKDTQADAKKLIARKWKSLVDENTELAEWQIGVAFDITSSGFGLVKTAITGVSTGGLSLIKDLIGLIDNIVTFTQGIYKLAVEEEKAREELEKSIKAVEDKLAKRQTTFEKIKEYFKSSENKLDDNLETYRNKAIEARKKAEKMSKALDKVLELQEEISNTMEEDVPGLDEAVAMTKKYLEAIDRLTAGVKVGKALMKKGEDLLEDADSLTEAQKLLSEVYEFYKKIDAYTDPVDGLIEGAMDLGQAASKKLNQYHGEKQKAMIQ